MASQGGYWGTTIQGGNIQDGGWGNNQGPKIYCGEGCTIVVGPTQGGNSQCGSGNTQGAGGRGNYTHGANNQGGGYGYPQR
ncbi:hypothetical protein JCGZ_16829 [Jatropha curcas]|uniref:Uncharacterized protein n=1 Tax=Jatropha curcas TaxID=180498 RepID=A0A067L540_JATCU|nr:hypothetical protein JCGZ_16829 [Jatropha curcas]